MSWADVVNPVLRKIAGNAIVLFCCIPLGVVLMALLVTAGMIFVSWFVLILEAEHLVKGDAAYGPDGIGAVLLRLIDEEGGSEPAA
jgi:hypothetical protein